MHKLAIVILGLICVIGLTRTYTNGYEHMTRIMRTVGVANEANETQVAAGVVNSVPIMDYTHTYWDGGTAGAGNLTSCDECPNMTVCPHCPQYQQTASLPVDNLNASSAVSEHFMVAGGGIFPHEMILDSDYMVSRERMGACTSRSSMHQRPRHQGYERPSAEWDSRRVGFRTGSALVATTLNVPMGALPAPDDCEYYGHNGYLYKEPCAEN